ncbi:type III secretion system inner membrane ring lipoprotein SctJ [uncultured Tateyamaria sp.]|uniref:type III secretion system inner membrane ring lipoprotein SctJ n=1 Tax=uncultured Tateyamaria sp. TaxID=455651 RepID=UPI00261ED2DF|nr:type III secretion inner membrane ring lipoprotein SctJ [uncultured Tateyamaria sp.]
MLGNLISQTARTGAVVGLCLILGACKEDVYSNLAEREVNEMVAVLSASGIVPSRQRDKDGAYALRVESADVPAAITLLRNAGYPRETFQSLGEVFNAEGVFGTPFEQHARYIHAMNQELSSTITAIDGIRSAKVLVTAPPRGRFDREAPRATASVAIHHENGEDVRSNMSSIKMLVAHALPNLDYDDVAVALFEAGGPVATPAQAAALTTEAANPASVMSVFPPLDQLRSHIGAERFAALLGGAGIGAFLLLLMAVSRGRRS